MTERAATLAELHEALRSLEDRIVDRVEQRVKKQRPKAQRRVRSPETSATLALARVPGGSVSALAQRRADKALAKLRGH